MPKEPSGRIYRNALEFYHLAAPAFDDNAILIASPHAVVCNLALCIELLLKCSDSGVKAPLHGAGRSVPSRSQWSIRPGAADRMPFAAGTGNPDVWEQRLSGYARAFCRTYGAGNGDADLRCAQRADRTRLAGADGAGGGPAADQHPAGNDGVQVRRRGGKMCGTDGGLPASVDRKSTRLNSSH